MVCKWLSPEPVREHVETLAETALKYGRSAFLRDYGAIVHSSKFRRLANKTQVYLNPQIDYPRTRLPHSLEVSQIGRQLARALAFSLASKKSLVAYSKLNPYSNFSRDIEDVVATACLAHDLGQPPFGHKGDKVLSRLLGEHGCESFDANKQNVRLLVGSPGRAGMEVSCALVDAVMKYKRGLGSKAPGYYNYEEKVAKHVISVTGTEGRRNPACYLMEASDDIAYISGDVEDGLRLGILEVGELSKKLAFLPFMDDNYKAKEGQWRSFLRRHSHEPEQISSLIIKSLVAHTIKGLVEAVKGCELDDMPEFMERFVEKRNNVEGEELNFLYWGDLGEGLGKLKKFVYRQRLTINPDVQQGELLAEKVIKELWVNFLPLTSPSYKKSPVFHIVPSYIGKKIEGIHSGKGGERLREGEQFQLIADYISGMTDRYALDMWERLNSPARLLFAG